MPHRFSLFFLGSILIAFGLVERGWAWLAVWAGVDFLILAIAHTRAAHRVFGKRRDGTLPPWSWVLFLPLLIYTTAVWHLLRLFSREPSHAVVNKQVVIGRRLLESELVGEFENYVDLTAEFVEPAAMRRLTGYRSFPILDGSAPSPEALETALSSLRPGRTFVHCAQGHGRTGMFALAILLRSGAVRTIEEGEKMLRQVRPRVRLCRGQRRCLEQYMQRGLFKAGR
jgi:hypothetical protein